MRNIKLTIEYDGKDFNGWQKQPNKLNIQGTIEQAIKTITGEEIELNLVGIYLNFRIFCVYRQDMRKY